MLLALFIIGGIFVGAIIGSMHPLGIGFTAFMAMLGAVIFGVIGKIFLIAMTPGKTDPATMTDDEKKTHEFEKENLTGFSGGFFGQTAIMITNLLVAATKKPGYQQHPELFAVVYGVITFGIGFFRDSVVQDLLNSNNISSGDIAKEVIDTDDN